MEELTDGVLLQLLHLGDESAIGALDDRYGRVAIHRLTGHSVMLKLPRTLFKSQNRIMIVVHQRCIDISRKRPGVTPGNGHWGWNGYPKIPTTPYLKVPNPVPRLGRSLGIYSREPSEAIQLAFY